MNYEFLFLFRNEFECECERWNGEWFMSSGSSAATSSNEDCVQCAPNAPCAWCIDARIKNFSCDGIFSSSFFALMFVITRPSALCVCVRARFFLLLSNAIHACELWDWCIPEEMPLLWWWTFYVVWCMRMRGHREERCWCLMDKKEFYQNECHHLDKKLRHINHATAEGCFARCHGDDDVPTQANWKCSVQPLHICIHTRLLVSYFVQ